MNIFLLDTNPEIAAKMHCDSHVVKMVSECLQMLRAYTNSISDKPVFFTAKGKPVTGYRHHPCTTWIGESKAHFDWIVQLAEYLNLEWQLRYNHDRNHASMADLPLVKATCESIGAWPTTEHLSWAMAVPDRIYKGDRIAYKLGEIAVKFYRQFYIEDKSGFAAWAFLDLPDWWAYDMFPAGMAFCKLNKAYFTEIDQVDAYRIMNESDGTEEYELAESFKKKRKKKEVKPPTLAEKVRNHIKSRLQRKIPRVSTIDKWIAEHGKDYNRLIELANDYITENYEHSK